MYLRILVFLVLLQISWEDYKAESFHPHFGLIVLGFSFLFYFYNWLSISVVLISLSSIIGWNYNYIRLGDTIPLLLLAVSQPRVQTLFTLLTVTGLYLTLYKNRQPDKQWIPFTPAILITYIIQLPLV